MSDTKVSLRSLLVPNKGTTVEFPGFPGFTIDLVFLTKEKQIKLRKESIKKVFDIKTRLTTDEFDEDKFLEKYVEATSKGWSGLKYSYLVQLVPMDELSESDMEKELPYSVENVIELMKASTVFDQFYSESVTNLALFQKSSAKN